MRALLVIIFVIALVDDGLSCGRKRRRKGLQGLQKCADGAVKCQLGENVQTTPYTGGTDSPGDCNQLNCNLENSCCWNNAVPPSDEFNFAKGTGQADPLKLQKNFATGEQPSGSYFITASETAGTPNQAAQLYSCPITCSQGDITVKLKHWQTAGTKIQVCQTQDPAGPPQNCQDLPPQSGQVDQVTIPKGQNVRAVIQAKGFTSPDGDVAIVQDIEVQCEQCVTTTTAGPSSVSPSPGSSPAPGKAPCKEVNCDFKGNTCAYSKASGGGNAAEGWAVHEPTYQNRLTGIPKAPPSGHTFAGCYTKKKGEKATLATNANFDKEYVVRYFYYKATEGMSFKACCNDESNCPKASDKAVQTADYRAWKQESVSCPAGTKKVIFVCENNDGASEGACGLSKIQLYEACGGDASSCSKAAC